MALSYVRIEPEAVVFRRWPRRRHRIPRSDVDRFEVMDKGDDGLWQLAARTPNMRLSYLALLLKDGRSLRVPSKGQPAVVALRLNNELLR